MLFEWPQDTVYTAYMPFFLLRVNSVNYAVLKDIFFYMNLIGLVESYSEFFIAARNIDISSTKSK